MKTSKLFLSFLFIAFLFASIKSASAQCTWKTQITDGFEYQTPCPDLIPGTTVHVIPQTFAVHNGTYSLYMNFIDCNGSTGACAGDTVYKRTIPVCPNTPFRISSWFTTSFAGLQCDVHIVIVDANNLILANNLSIQPPYAPTWFQYQSGTLTPVTSTISFIIITNVGGSPAGNDLSMDDFLMEQCQTLNLGPDTTFCNLDSMLLDAGAGYATYSWSNGASSQSIYASSTGSGPVFYSVTVTNGSGCTFSDTMKVVYTICTSVEENDKEKMVSIFPNPASDEIEISGLQANLKSEIKILNALGQKVFQSPLTPKGGMRVKVPFGDLGAGMYFVQIKTNSFVQTKKLCIKH